MGQGKRGGRGWEMGWGEEAPPLFQPPIPSHAQISTNIDLKLSRQNTSFVATKVCLSQQFCRDKNILSRQKICFVVLFVATKVTHVCRDKHNFVATSVFLSRQHFCRDELIFVATKDVFCLDKHAFVATKIILVAVPANDRTVSL